MGFCDPTVRPNFLPHGTDLASKTNTPLADVLRGQLFTEQDIEGIIAKYTTGIDSPRLLPGASSRNAQHRISAQTILLAESTGNLGSQLLASDRPSQIILCFRFNAQVVPSAKPMTSAIFSDIHTCNPIVVRYTPDAGIVIKRQQLRLNLFGS
ncbi:hypothetical protein GYMLUDRAFT_250569 [Collybiopsis luxurians FD-317 M1]|uniref:Uncharacterized protein n=1 Tax=Collybiopsis luxurians FD-317 M1 TaxID=944289 RepID=A0A0D0C5L7_9AGAR|nr:hypothetical protein GYMLUDRAFT_250569 [Collybiopsis luxurians FD-317 M1]